MQTLKALSETAHITRCNPISFDKSPPSSRTAAPLTIFRTSRREEKEIDIYTGLFITGLILKT